MFIGAIIGLLTGIIMGAFEALTARDGIWPEVWAFMIMVCTAIGMVVGLLANLI